MLGKHLDRVRYGSGAVILVEAARESTERRQAVRSPNTIGTHLRQVYTKLGINSCAELARIAVERDLRR
jgi:DNA-binding NarL/FixJ family response regulator